MSTPNDTTEEATKTSASSAGINVMPIMRAATPKVIAAATAAFVLGVIGTVTVMSRNHAPMPVATQTSATTGGAGTTTQDKPADAPLIKFSAAAMGAAGIKVATVQRSLSADVLSVPGTVMTKPNLAARITPPVSGKIVRIYANLGDAVRAGQILVELDSVDVAQAHAAVRQAESNVVQAAAAVNTARAQVQEAQAKQASAEATLERQKQLAHAGAFAQAPLAAAQSELSQAQTELAQAQTELQTRTSAEARAQRLFSAQIVSRAEMEQSQADLRQSQARSNQAGMRVDLAKQALAREHKIYMGSMLNKQAIQTAEADVRSARAETLTAIRQAQAASAALQGTRTAVDTARSNLNSLEGDRHAEGGGGLIVLRAPIGGVVTERQATIGEAVERSTSLFEVENLDTILVSANVPEAQIGQIRLGQHAEILVSAYPDQRFSGVVQSIASRVDEKTRALPVRLQVDNPEGRLRPEMFASVSLGVGARSNDVVVPASAVDDDGPDRFVYVERPGGFEKRSVEVGRSTHNSAVILSGLQPGERVVTDGAFIVKSESKKDELKGDD